MLKMVHEPRPRGPYFSVNFFVIKYTVVDEKTVAQKKELNMLKKLNTLKIKFPLISFFTYLALVSVILVACYIRFSSNVKETYISHGKEILNLAAEDIIIDHIPDYLSGDYDIAEYESSARKLDLYPRFFDDVFYLYAYHLNDDGVNATYIFDAHVDHDTTNQLGDNYEIEDDILAQISKHGEGEPLDAVTDNTKWGYLLTCSKPLLDSKGNFQGYLLVDFDLTKIRHDNRMFFLKLFFVAFAHMLVVFALGMQAVAVRITNPIEKIYLCLSKFRYATQKDREENLRSLQELKIHTNQEIQSLYEALISSAESNLRYMNEYRTISEKAHTDVLTGVRNKTAFEDMAMEFLERIDTEESPEIALIMADINNLKYINDTFGHKSGDEYIIGCCKIMSDLCNESHIFRIGGDEFIIILNGNEYADRQMLYEKLKSKFVESYTDETQDPWRRYSASLGYAEYEATDTGITDVMKRADAEMYKDKEAFKKTYGSYR